MTNKEHTNFLDLDGLIQERNQQFPHFSAVRKDAYHSFKNLGIPGVKNEEYKYTPIEREINKNHPSNLLKHVPESKLSKKDVQQYMEWGEGAHLIFINGQFKEDLSSLPEADGLEIDILSSLMDKEDHWAIKKLSQRKHPSEDAFAQLNLALFQEGLAIRVRKSKVVEPTLYLHFISDGSIDRPWLNTCNLIWAEENSQVKVVEMYHALGEHTSFVNHASTLFCDQRAQLEFYQIQTELDGHSMVNNAYVEQHKDAVFKAFTISTSGKMIRNNLHISLEEEHCEAHMYGLYFLNEDQHVDNHTTVDHRYANSYSNEVYKGILGGTAKGVFNGKIFVRQDAQKTNAFQSNDNVLLSPDAKIDTKPQLEIWADDVKCSHGATIGQLDEEQLFYLRARGIDKKQAKNLLLNAFAGDVLQEISLSRMKEKLSDLIAQKLTQ